MNYSLRRVRHASKGEKILCVGKGQPSGDLDFLSYGCRILALFARVRFLGSMNRIDSWGAGGPSVSWGDEVGCPTRRVYVWEFWSHCSQSLSAD